jgi:hypothetical protein
MKKTMISQIEYSRVFNTGDYENEKIGVVVEVGAGENPQEALNEAKKFVELSSKNVQGNLAQAKHVVEHPDDYTGKQVQAAKDLLSKFYGKNPLLPAVKESK